MNYVAGFMFSHDGSQVALIRKNKPAWQFGLLNGIGGKLEDHELPIDAMVREFEEETSVKTKARVWNHFALIGSDSWSVQFYAANGELSGIRSNEDEQIEIVEVASINPTRKDMIENLPWLIALAVDTLTDGRPDFTEVKYPK